MSIPLPILAALVVLLTAATVLSLIELLSKTGGPDLKMPFPPELVCIVLFGVGAVLLGKLVEKQSRQVLNIAFFAGFGLAAGIVILGVILRLIAGIIRSKRS